MQTSWHRLVSAQFPIIYLYTLFLTYWHEKFKVKNVSNAKEPANESMLPLFILPLYTS